MRWRSFLRYQFPALAWGGLIFAASSIPSSKIPSRLLETYDKVIHATIFFVLGLLVYRAIAPRDAMRSFAGARMALAVGIVILYGATDELHQAWVPGRTVDILDLTADTVGGLVAAGAVFLLTRVRRAEG